MCVIYKKKGRKIIVFKQLTDEEKEQIRKVWYTGVGNPDQKKKVDGVMRLVDMRRRLQAQAHKRWQEKRDRWEAQYKREEGGINLDRWARWAIQDEDVKRLDLSRGGALRFKSDYEAFYKDQKFEKSNVFGVPIIVPPKSKYGIPELKFHVPYVETPVHEKHGVKVYGTEAQEKGETVSLFREEMRKLREYEEHWLKEVQPKMLFDIEYDVDAAEREFLEWHSLIKEFFPKKHLKQFIEHKCIPYPVWFRVRHWRKKVELTDLRDYMFFGAVYLEDWILELGLDRGQLLKYRAWREKEIEAESELEEEFLWEVERYRGRLMLYFEALNDELRFLEIYVFSIGEQMIVSHIMSRWNNEDDIFNYSGLPEENKMLYLFAIEEYFMLLREQLQVIDYLNDFEVTFGCKNKYFGELEKWRQCHLIEDFGAYLIRLKEKCVSEQIDDFMELNVNLIENIRKASVEDANELAGANVAVYERLDWEGERGKKKKEELEVVLLDFLNISGLGWNPGVHESDYYEEMYEEREESREHRLMADIAALDYAVDDFGRIDRTLEGKDKADPKLDYLARFGKELGNDEDYAHKFEEDPEDSEDFHDFASGLTDDEFHSWTDQ